MKKWMYWILTGVILCSTPGCTQKTGNSVPEDAMFCDNLAERVQEVEQLHVETATGTTEFSPSDSAPVYAMWFPVMEYADTLQGKSQEEFRQAMRERFQKTADLGINTVYLHVRAYQDAYYRSEHFPGAAMPIQTLILTLSRFCWKRHMHKICLPMPGSIPFAAPRTRPCRK